MNNKELISYMEKIGGSNINDIKINNLDSMLETEGSNSSEYTNSIIDLFFSSDSDSSYDSEGGKGKSKSKKTKKTKKAKKQKKNKDSENNLETDDYIQPVVKPVINPSNTPTNNLSNLANLVSTSNLIKPIDQIPNIMSQQVSPSTVNPQLLSLLSNLTQTQPNLTQPNLTQPNSSIMINPQVLNSLIGMLQQLQSQLISSQQPTIKLSGGNIDLDQIDKELNIVKKKFNL